MIHVPQDFDIECDICGKTENFSIAEGAADNTLIMNVEEAINAGWYIEDHGLVAKCAECCGSSRM